MYTGVEEKIKPKIPTMFFPTMFFLDKQEKTPVVVRNIVGH